jgi:hypothetical protein
MAFPEASSGARGREDRIVYEVTSWPGVTTRPERYGGLEFCVGDRPIGHVHGGWQADIAFPRAIRDRLVADDRTGPHHIYVDSGWTTLRIRTEADAEAAIDLLRINYDRAQQRRDRAGGHKDDPSAPA